LAGVGGQARPPFAAHRAGRVALAVSALLALGAARARAEAPVAELARAKVEAIEAAVTADMTRLAIPGLSVAVATQGALRFTNGYGLADVENGVPAKASTVYRLASVSKPITSVAVLQLVEKGLLELDAPIQRYVPAFPEKQWPVTARALLGHLGGVRHYRDDEPTNTRPCPSVLEGLSFFKDDALVQEPGTKFLYSTYGYNLLGAAVEGASGRSYLDYLRENVFPPASMTSTRVDEVAAIIPNRAQGYTRAGGGIRNADLADVSYKVPGGGLCSTAADVARFGLALAGGSLLKRETLAQMLASQRTRDGRATGYGLGLNVAAVVPGKHREAWHTGGQERVSTVIFLLPDDGLSIAVLCNLEGVGSDLVALSRRIVSIVSAEAAPAAGATRR
jgi:serine beta-lactamase-like protein LACTB, mitochondrial